MFYVYLLESGKHYYVGFTHDLKRRIKEHNASQNIATKAYIPWTIIFYESYLDQDDATRRERYLKTSQGKQALRRMIKSYSKKKGQYFDY